MTNFGWSYPPGCSSIPDDEVQAIQLHDDSTLIGYGRRQHGLMGKDADLDEVGQVVVKEAWWLDDETVQATIQCYASVCGNEEWNEEQWHSATEIICGGGQQGEWDGDYWVLTYNFTLKYRATRKTKQGVIADLYRKIMADKGLQAFQREIKGCHEAFNAMDSARGD